VFVLEGSSTRALIKSWQLSVIRLHVQAAALSGVAHSRHEMRACVGTLNEEPWHLRSCRFTGKQPCWQCADSCLRASASCRWLWSHAKMGFDGLRLLGVSVHMLQKACIIWKGSIILRIKSKALLRAREADALLVPQVGKGDMCLWYLDSVSQEGAAFNGLYLFYLLSNWWFQR